MNQFKQMLRPKLFLLAASIGFCGCSSVDDTPPGMPSLVPVTLNVQQGGAPLEGASVQLISADAANAWASGGSSDAEGNVKVMTLGKFEGAPEGKYKVVVAKTITEGGGGDSNDPSVSTESKMYDYVDVKYQLADKTPLEIEVSAGDPGEPKVIDVGAPIKKEVPKI